MSRFIRWLGGAVLWCAKCEEYTAHLTEVDGWQCCRKCGETKWGDE